MNYRDRLYARYESTFKNCSTPNAQRSQRIADRLFPFMDWLPADRHSAVLDIGCGSGDLLQALSVAGYSNLTGIDLGPEQVASARSRGLNVFQEDAVAHLLAHPASYDLVIACDVLEHLTRDELFVLLSALKSGVRERAVMLVRVPNAAAPRGNVLQFGDLTHETAFSPGSLRQLFNSVGVRAVELREDAPYNNTVLRAVRRALWKGLRGFYSLADVVETGATLEVYTRNLLARIDF